MTEGDQTQLSNLSDMSDSETVLDALRRQEVDAIVGDSKVLLLRLHQVEKNLRESEEQLRELNKTLEQRISERTAELENQTQRLRSLTHELTYTEQRERKRLAQVLHDGLQQLLIAVEVNLAMLPEELESEELDAAKQLIREATRASRSLAYELAPPVLYESSFSEALAWLVRWFREKYRFKVTLDVAADLPTLGENAKVFLFNIIRELLVNSFKHSGVLEAVVICAEVEEGWWHVEVQDAGNGFDPALLQNAAYTDKGFGLLSIRERLIALGGSLTVTSEPGAGAHFLIRFPESATEGDRLYPRPEAPVLRVDEPNPTPASRSGQEIRILVVDDHRVVREALAAMLVRQPNFKVVGEAGDGVQAVELADQLLPDVIVMDINMPRMDGIEATRRIKEKHPATQIVGLSLHKEADNAEAMRRAGAAAYLPKEAAAKTLIETLNNL